MAPENYDVVRCSGSRVRTLGVAIVTLLKESLGDTIQSVKAVIPDPNYAVGSSVWMLKPFFAFPFILEYLRDRKKRSR
jgi:hypothetical protein